MENDPLFSVIFWLQVGLCAWFFYGPHRQYWIDRTRYRLFVIRDKLFANAENRVIAFEHPAYINTRETIHGMLRNIEDDNWLRLLLIWRWFQRSADGKQMLDEYIRERDSAMIDLSEDTKKMLQNIRIEAAMAVISYVAKISLPLWFLFCFLRLLFKVKYWVRDWVMDWRFTKAVGETIGLDGDNAMGTHLWNHAEQA